MHKAVVDEITRLINDYDVPKSGNMLDVGSLDVNGNYRFLFPDFEYIGVDIREGANVDVVMNDPEVLPFPDNCFDVVISGSCIEHCVNPFTLVAEMGRVVKVGGWVIINAPFAWMIHSYPSDYWRFTPEGMRVLMERAGLEVKEVFLRDANEVVIDPSIKKWEPVLQDCHGIAVKV